MNLDERLETNDQKLLAISALGILFFGGLLISDNAIVGLFKQRHHEESIGKVIITKNDVRRRTARSLTWYSANDTEELFEQDSLYTGSDSGLSVELTNSQTIDVDSNSLIVLHSKENSLVLDLKIGSVSASVVDNQKINILHDGEITEVKADKKASPIMIRKNKQGGLLVSSQTGDVVVKKGSKQINIKKNETKSVEQVMDSSLPIVEAEFKLSGPKYFVESWPTPKEIAMAKEGSSPWDKDRAPVPIDAEKKIVLKFKSNSYLRSPAEIDENILNPPQFRWQAVENARGYGFEISQSKNFAEVLYASSVTSTEETWKSARPGKYFWRVKALSESNEETKASQPVNVSVELPKPELKSPDLKKEVTEDPRELGKEKEFNLQWAQVPLAKKYRFVASVADKAVMNLELKKNTVLLKVPPNEKVKLKVFAVDESGNAISQEGKYEFVYKRDLHLKTPEAVLPDNKTTIMSLNKETIPPILLAWKKNKFAESYELQFSSSPDFDQILLNTKTPVNRFVLNEKISSEEIYWRVRSRFQGYTSEWSEPRSFDVRRSR